MNIRQITADMDDEDRNVAHDQNAMEYFKHGMLEAARAENALDRGFLGTFEEFCAHAEIILRKREAEEKANESMSWLYA